MPRHDALIRTVVLEILREGKGPIEDTIAWCRDMGIPVDRTSRGHWRVRVPGGGIVVTSGTPSDHRAGDNFRSGLRRALRAAAARGDWDPRNMP